MRAITHSFSLKVIIVLSLVLGCFAYVPSASALSNISPNPSDMLAIDGATQTVGGVSHLLKKEDVAKVLRLRVGVYFGTAGDKSLQIDYGVDGKKCYVNNKVTRSNSTKVNQDGQINVKIGSGTNETTYPVKMVNQVCADRNPVRNNVPQGQGTSQQRANNKFFANYKIPSAALEYDANIGKYKAEVTVAYNADVKEGQRKENSVNFILRLAQANGIIAPLANSSPDELGLRSAFMDNRNGPGNSEIQYRIIAKVAFGVPCNLPEGQKKLVALYDADTNVFGPTYLRVQEGSANLPLVRYDTSPSPQKLIWDGDTSKRWLSTAEESNNDDARNSIVYVNGLDWETPYSFIIENPDNSNLSKPGPPQGDTYAGPNGNTLSIGIPYDSIYSEVSCGYTLTPSVDEVPRTFAGDSPDFDVTGRIGLKPEDTETHDWRLTVRTYDSQPSDVGRNGSTTDTACQWRAGQVGSCQTMASGNGKKFTSDFFETSAVNMPTDVPLGTWVCFMMSVKKPTLTSATNIWSHSALECTVSGKQPKVQIRGHDLRTLGSVNTSIDARGGKLYGSWGEYGILANGCNAGYRTASGAALHEGAATSNIVDLEFHRLMFANEPGPDSGAGAGICLGSPYGYFGGVEAYDPESYKDGDIQADPLETGYVDIDPSFVDTSQGSRKVLYYPKATVRITDNIEYGNNYTSIRKIPRVVIIAKNIIIKSDVKHIDAWLIAKENVTTCDRLDDSKNYNWDQAALDADGACGSDKLTFNGPVMANKIFLYRTAGSNDDDLDEPAEIFNLRADVWLSSLTADNNHPVATTDMVTELPPRF